MTFGHASGLLAADSSLYSTFASDVDNAWLIHPDQALCPLAAGAVVPRARLVERLNLGLDSRMMLRFRTCGLRLDHTLASWLASTPPHPPHVHLVICQPCGSAVAAGSPTRRGELDVLRLLATDLDGPEIASQLMVLLNTLRTHTKSIYTRLGVNSRRAAVHRAGELHLLSAISTR